MAESRQEGHVKGQERFVLRGGEYISERLLKIAEGYPAQGKIFWADVPPVLRATEERVRRANGARDEKWLEAHLTTYGCLRAEPFGGVFLQCHYKILQSGFCKRHDPDRQRQKRSANG